MKPARGGKGGDQKHERLQDGDKREKSNFAENVCVDALSRNSFPAENWKFSHDLLRTIAATEPHRRYYAEEHSHRRFVGHPTDKQTDKQWLHEQESDVENVGPDDAPLARDEERE